jgi:hypothetical protein
MDTVLFDGVKYLKASAAAKQFNYTSDYIGQLCRLKKIDARLVGRTWFVNVDALVAHKSNKYGKTSEDVRPKTLAEERNEAKKVAVLPAFTNRGMKSMPAPSLQSSIATRKIRVHYEIDDEDLIPNIIRKKVRPPKVVRVIPADAERVRIRSGKSLYDFQPDTLPDVALSGHLQIEGLPESEPEVEATEAQVTDSKQGYENIAMLDVEEKTRPVSEVKIIRYTSPDRSLSEKREAPVPSTKSKIIYKKPSEKQSSTNVRAKNEIRLTPITAEMIQPVKISRTVLFSPLIATFFSTGLHFSYFFSHLKLNRD